jgi:TM2 domain-containing membrane protein YozV
VAQPGQQPWWWIVEGGFPGCPVGAVVAFVNEGDAARVVIPGGGQIGTLHRSSTTQVASSDGQTITLTNAGEGWRAVLSRSAAAPAAAWTMPASGKDRLVATTLAILFGDFGIHKFYLGKAAQGAIYLFFCWTGIPGLVAWIDAITYLLKTNEAWADEYGGPVRHPSSVALGCLWILVALPLLAIVGIIAVILFGGQVSRIPQ